MTTPCIHLDYTEGKFMDCTIVDLSPDFDVRYWLRGKTWTEQPPDWPPVVAKVQFCRLRGRINGIFQCYNAGEMPCYEIEATS